MTPEQTRALAELAKLYPAGKRGVLPVDDYWQRPVTITLPPVGTPRGIQPYSLTRSQIRGVKFYEAAWMNGAPARFIGKRASTVYLDMCHYATRYREITGELPTWAS